MLVSTAGLFLLRTSSVVNDGIQKYSRIYCSIYFPLLAVAEIERFVFRCCLYVCVANNMNFTVQLPLQSEIEFFLDFLFFFKKQNFFSPLLASCLTVATFSLTKKASKGEVMFMLKTATLEAIGPADGQFRKSMLAS